MVDSSPKFYFLVVFWGSGHRAYFEDYCLASLLADGNIPTIENKGGSKFLICTTRPDWEELQKSPLFAELTKHIQAEWLEMIHPEPSANKMNVMSQGHKRLTERAFEDQVYAINVNPDTIFSSHTMVEMQRHANEGRTLVMHCAIRFELEGVTEELKSSGAWKDKCPLVLSARDAAGIGLRNRHSELIACNFNSGAYWDYPVHTYLDIPGEEGIAIHCFSWAAVLVNYARVKEHNTETFDEWTLDGDYIQKNFGNLDVDKEFYVCRDSDEFFLLSVTPKDEANVPDTPTRIKSARIIGKWYRGFLMKQVFEDSRIDAMKKLIFLDPVRIHGNELNDAWEEVEDELNWIILNNISPVNESWAGISVADEVKNRQTFALRNYYLGAATGWWVQKMQRVIVILIEVKRHLVNVVNLAIFYGFHEVIRIVVLFFAYIKIIVLALLGNKKEQDRIRKRFEIIRQRRAK